MSPPTPSHKLSEHYNEYFRQNVKRNNQSTVTGD